MNLPPLVGVLGSRIASQVAATIGYGNRELDLYQTSCIEPICEAGMLPVGVASADVASELEWCDLLSALVVPHDDGHCGLPIVIGALARHLPVLAIGSGEWLITAALADQATELSELGASEEPGSRGAGDGGGIDLSEMLGVSGGIDVPMLVGTASVPSGMRAAASGSDGSVYAVAMEGGPAGPALSVRWDPGSFPPGNQARDGPFRWLRDQAASPRPRAQPGRREHPSAREEVT